MLMKDSNPHRVSDRTFWVNGFSAGASGQDRRIRPLSPNPVGCHLLHSILRTGAKVRWRR
jgi:hypothetical protein